MKKYFYTIGLLLVLSVGIAGCGGKKEETEQPETTAVFVTESETTAPESSTEAAPENSTEAAPETESETETETESKESVKAETTKAPITEKEAKKLLLKTFGSTDESTGDKNVFTYEKVISVDGVQYYSYRWEDGNKNYFCNAFVKLDGSDVVTGIYANGRWELGSDAGLDDADDFGEADDSDLSEEGDEETEEPYDDGFGDIDSDYEEEADDEEMLE